MTDPKQDFFLHCDTFVKHVVSGVWKQALEQVASEQGWEQEWPLLKPVIDGIEEAVQRQSRDAFIAGGLVASYMIQFREVTANDLFAQLEGMMNLSKIQPKDPTG